jgi:D-alanyl-D-alanine carboxypeptidase
VRPSPSRDLIALLFAALAVAASSCGGASSAADTDPTTASPSTLDAAATTTATTTAPSTTTTTTSTTTSTTTTSTTSTTSSTSTTTSTTVEPLADPALPATNAAFDALAAANPAATLTVRRDGRVVLARASGATIDGAAATSDAPMVVASVSKLLTALLVARLDDAGLIDVDAPIPWAVTGITPHPAWNDVTPRELLTHTSGMPVVRRQWFERSGDCRSFLPALLGAPPQAHRGRWTYSNGNFCALGLVVEGLTGVPLDVAAQTILFEPIGLSGVHLTTGGQLPSDVGYAPGVDRLDRLGGAGSFIVSTDDLAAVVGATTALDREVITWPGIFVDQYGWGHTGSVDGAVSCVWMMELDRTVIAATVAGSRPSTGGAVCDRMLPALAGDLGIAATGSPDRSPR